MHLSTRTHLSTRLQNLNLTLNLKCITWDCLRFFCLIMSKTVLLNLQRIDLVIHLQDAVFRGHQLSLFGGDHLSDLLGFLLVLLQVAQLHLALSDRLILLEPQLTHRLQGFDIPQRDTMKKKNIFVGYAALEFEITRSFGAKQMAKSKLSLLGCCKDGVKLLFESFALTKWPVGLLLVTKDDMIEHRLGDAQCRNHLPVHFNAL